MKITIPGYSISPLAPQVTSSPLTFPSVPKSLSGNNFQYGRAALQTNNLFAQRMQDWMETETVPPEILLMANERKTDRDAQFVYAFIERGAEAAVGIVKNAVRFSEDSAEKAGNGAVTITRVAELKILLAELEQLNRDDPDSERVAQIKARVSEILMADSDGVVQRLGGVFHFIREEYIEAALRFSFAAEAFEREGKIKEAADSRTLEGKAFVRAQDFSESVRSDLAFSKAAVLYQQAGLTKKAAQAMYYQARELLSAGYVTEAVEAVNRAKQMSGENSILFAKLVYLEGRIAERNDSRAAYGYYDQAAEIAENIGEISAIQLALEIREQQLNILLNSADDEASNRKITSIFKKNRDLLEKLAVIHKSRSHIHGERKAILEWLDSFREEPTQKGSGAASLDLSKNKIRRAFERLLELNEQLIEANIKVGNRSEAGLLHQNSANILLILHREDEAITHFETAVALFRQIGDKERETINGAVLRKLLGQKLKEQPAFDPDISRFAADFVGRPKEADRKAVDDMLLLAQFAGDPLVLSHLVYMFDEYLAPRGVRSYLVLMNTDGAKILRNGLAHAGIDIGLNILNRLAILVLQNERDKLLEKKLAFERPN